MNFDAILFKIPDSLSVHHWIGVFDPDPNLGNPGVYDPFGTGQLGMNEATARAERVASGQSGTLRVGFTESASWHGVVPDSFRQFRQRQPDAELQLNPLSSLEQVEAIRASRLDAGFVFNMPKGDRELNQVQVEWHNLVLA